MKIEERIKEHEEILKRLNQKKKNINDTIIRIDEKIKHNEEAIENLKIKNSKIEYDRMKNPPNKGQKYDKRIKT